MQPFTRQLGSQSGVQVNPIIDKSEGRLVGMKGNTSQPRSACSVAILVVPF